ncbi:MAG: hypothetical protein JSU75_05405 [Gammaproteobacteria bacterium]|nr:MAG: hypothetical protein JSU75_05405 [Gammaproteobacteria bacterium]
MEALKDKRYTEVPVPDNLDEYLNEAQLRTLRKVEDFGWQLAFIRRPLFQEILPVVVSDDGVKHGVLEEDGSINMHHKLLIRE